MCGTKKFCGPCVSVQVILWANGETHAVPQFGDGAQRRVAISQRGEVIRQVLATRPERIQEFPEWTILALELKVNSNLPISEVVARFPVPMSRPGFGASRRHKRKYKKYMERWNGGRVFDVIADRLSAKVRVAAA